MSARLFFCLRSNACQLVATGPAGFISARLRGEALRHFTQTPLAEWIDGFTPIGEILGEHVDSLSDKLQAAAEQRLHRVGDSRHLHFRVVHQPAAKAGTSIR